MEHLEYDLVFTIAFTAPLTLTAIDLTGPDGCMLLRLAGDALTVQTEPLFLGNLDSVVDAAPITQIPVADVVATVIDLALPPDAAPARISHQISYALPPNTPARALIAGRAVSGLDLTVASRAALVISPPLRGTGWISVNGCCAQSSHRSARSIEPEIFAIDYQRHHDGQLYLGDGSQNGQYFAEGDEVVSVAAGTVVSVLNDMPEQSPNQPHAGIDHAFDYSGNNVVVQIQPGVYATYAHLQPGSVTVQVGDQVTTGQLLGRLGSSGNSTAPHLHFQLSDGPDLLTATSLPFVADRYTLAGALDAAQMAAAFADPSAPGNILIVGTPRSETDTYPMSDTVQDFP